MLSSVQLMPTGGRAGHIVTGTPPVIAIFFSVWSAAE